MNEDGPDAPVSSLLPRWIAEVRCRRAVSSDGQIYLQARDGSESRVDSSEVFGLLGEKRPRKKRPSLDRAVRHLVHERRRCDDCGAESDVVWFAWAERRCDVCWSTNVAVLTTETRPPRPPRFGSIGQPPASWHNVGRELGGHSWGLSANDDAQMLRSHAASYGREDSGTPHLYTLLLFGQSLAELPSHVADPGYFNLLLNVGNVAQRYFRSTGSREAARATLDAFDRAGSVADHPVPAALAAHSFAMAVIYILDALDEREAELATGRPSLRTGAVTRLAEAIQLAEAAKAGDPEGTATQVLRMRYALADLLRGGHAGTAERAEALSILSDLDLRSAGPLATHIQVARAETQLALPLPPEPTAADADPWYDAIEFLQDLAFGGEPGKLEHRWRWALTIGRTVLRLGGVHDALPYLESAVTFLLKDTGFRTDPLAAAADSERYHQAFNTLAAAYVSIGWAFEGLALLETYRGRALELASLDPSAREQRKSAADQRRDDTYYGSMFGPGESPTLILTEEASWEQLQGKRFGPFADDYELPGLEERIGELFAQLSDVPTVLVSISLEASPTPGETVVAAVVLGPPDSPEPRVRAKTWTLTDGQLAGLTSQLYRRAGSFQRRRLVALGQTIFTHLLEPISVDLREFRCERAVIVTPSSLSNLPIETYRAPERAGLPAHVAVMPSFSFGGGRRPPPRNPAGERLLVIGYDGADLPNAAAEAEALLELFGERATYLAGHDCTKRTVVEHLNADYDYVHLICHGSYDSDHPLESALHFREDRRAEAYRIRAREIETLVRFARRPVLTLSACSTALTADSRSNTWNGLPGAFLRAGARCVIGTRWPVHDAAAARMMADLYRGFLTTDDSPLRCFHAMQASYRLDDRVEEWACFGYLGLP